MLYTEVVDYFIVMSGLVLYPQLILNYIYRTQEFNIKYYASILLSTSVPVLLKLKYR